MASGFSIAALKCALYSDNAAIAQQACDQLVEIGGPAVTDFFILLLDQTNPRLRDLAALGLHDLADNRASEPLLSAINKPENQNYCGTMAFALETLDCSEKFTEIFELLFYGNAEVKMAVKTILYEQTFIFSNEDFLAIKHKWETIKISPHTSPYLNEDDKITIDYFLTKYSVLYT